LLVNGEKNVGVLNVNALRLSIPQLLRKKLQKNYFTGYITFEYLDEGIESIIIKSDTDKVPRSKFSVVGEIKTGDSGMWKKARIKLINENIRFKEANKTDFTFSGRGKVRDLSFDFAIYSIN